MFDFEQLFFFLLIIQSEVKKYLYEFPLKWVISKSSNMWPILLLRYKNLLDERDLEEKLLFTVATAIHRGS